MVKLQIRVLGLEISVTQTNIDILGFMYQTEPQGEEVIESFMLVSETRKKVLILKHLHKLISMEIIAPMYM